MKIKAFAASKQGQSLENFEYEPQPLAAHEAEVKISHCGVCHSDLHLLNNDWGNSKFPLVPGHEIIGTVSEVGSLVQHIRVGQRVGIGWQCGSCMTCDQCMSGKHNLCANRVATCNGRYGGFADRIRADSRFMFVIPDALPSHAAAPLLCGGITVFSPLLRFGVLPIHRVGVIGIGGLGHLAIQFARAFGCEVTAFSQTPEKSDEAKKMGAHHFVNTKDATALMRLSNSLDFIINTTNANLEWTAYLNCLRASGKLVFVGVPPAPIQVPVFALLPNSKSVHACPIGSPSEIRQMLEFAARHKIQAVTEVRPLSEVNEAIGKVKDNSVRYRMVLEVK